MSDIPLSDGAYFRIYWPILGFILFLFVFGFFAARAGNRWGTWRLRRDARRMRGRCDGLHRP